MIAARLVVTQQEMFGGSRPGPGASRTDRVSLRTPGQEELADAGRMEPLQRDLAEAKIKARQEAFAIAWSTYVADPDARCGECSRPITDRMKGGLIFSGRAYCIGDRPRVWARVGHRVGLYP